MLNKERTTMRDHAHKNYMGGPSYDLSPFATLYVMATSSFFGEPGYYKDTRRGKSSREEELIKPEKYHRLTESFGSYGDVYWKTVNGKNRENSMVSAIEDSLEYDTLLTLHFLGWLRTEAHMRATPAVGLAIACHSKAVRNFNIALGTKVLRAVAAQILSRLDDVTNCLAYYLDTYGKPIPNALKKVLRARLERANEYELAKYTASGRSVSLLDAIKLVHAHTPAIDKFINGELKQTTEGNETWEGIVSNEGSNHDSWTKAVGVMGHMALLRNLRNLEKFNVDKSLYLQKLEDGVEKGKQLPFRYYSAYVNTSSYDIKKALERCIDKSILNLPILPGKSLILVDNSGSAQRCTVSKLSEVSVSTCGNLMGVITGLISEDANIGVFGDKLKMIPINDGSRGKASALRLLKMVNDVGEYIGEATENGIWLALDEITKSGEYYDRIFIYSDCQAGHGGLYGIAGQHYPVWNPYSWGHKYIDVPKMVQTYRSKVNPDCKLYSVQIGGYSDALTPEFYPNTCILGGWSPEILKFVTMYEKGPDKIENLFKELFDIKPIPKPNTDTNIKDNTVKPKKKTVNIPKPAVKSSVPSPSELTEEELIEAIKDLGYEPVYRDILLEDIKSAADINANDVYGHYEMDDDVSYTEPDYVKAVTDAVNDLPQSCKVVLNEADTDKIGIAVMFISRAGYRDILMVFNDHIQILYNVIND